LDSSYFDVVVCGSDLAGLVAAALLGRRGLRVLVCGFERLPATFTAAGHTLPRDPGLLPPPDAESVSRILRELNFLQIIRRRAPALQPPLQLILPRQRLDLGAAEVVTREVRREWPGEADTIVRALERLAAASAMLDPLLGSDLTLPPDGFWDRREDARVEGQLPPAGEDLLAPLGAEHPLRVGLSALTALTCGFAPIDLNSTVVARAYDLQRRGSYRLDGGLPALRALFFERIAATSGEIRERLTPEEVVVRRGKVVGLRVRPRDETIGLEHLVWADSVATLLPLCGDKASRKLREHAAAMRPACHRYTLCLVVRREALPEGMGPRVVAVRDPSQPLLEDNALAITVGSDDRQGNVPLWVECLVPATASATPGYLAVVRARVRDRLSRLLPFFERHLVVLASPHDGLPPELPESEARGTPPDPVRATPMAVTAALSPELPRTLAVAGVPHATGIKNLTLASAENLPGLGREGELIAAWGAARLIAGGERRREGNRREILIEDA
jgi:phytoene dehydrogenase-like protein